MTKLLWDMDIFPLPIKNSMLKNARQMYDQVHAIATSWKKEVRVEDCVM